MVRHAKTNNLKDITPLHIHVEGNTPYQAADAAPHFRSVSRRHPDSKIPGRVRPLPSWHAPRKLTAATLSSAPCFRACRSTNFFTGANAREAINAGRADYVPIFLSEVRGTSQLPMGTLPQRSCRSIPSRRNGTRFTDPAKFFRYTPHRSHFCSAAARRRSTSR